jgi:hypothetical protein
MIIEIRMRKNNLAYIRSNIYTLKRDYGEPADLYKRVVINDFQTGKKKTTRTKLHIKKVIILPGSDLINSQSLRVVDQKAQNVEVVDRIVIIDTRDVPKTFIIDDNDTYIIILHKRYEIKNIRNYEYDTGYILELRQTVGAEVAEIHDVSVRQKLIFNENIVNSSV